MSNEVETFQKIHNSFKRLHRLRGLVSLQSKISPDIFDVFSSYLSDLLGLIENEYDNSVRRSSPNRLRFAAMELSLNYEMAKTIMLTTDTPKPSSFESLEKCLRKFEKDQLADELFFIYFRSLNYLWLLYASRFANAFATIKDYSVRVERMYDSLQKDGERKFYDFQQLFVKTVDMPPMENGRQEIDILFVKNLQLLEVVYRGAGDTDSLANILQQQMKIRHASVSRLTSVQKIVALVPLLLSESKLKMAIYYLIVALKMLRECTESDHESDDVASARLTLATEWMNYAFAVLALSNDFLQATFPDEELEPLSKFLAQFDCGDPFSQTTITPGASKSGFNQMGDTHADQSFDSTKLFDTICLSPQEMLICVQSIDEIATGQQLFNYIIYAIEDFIRSTDVSATPMNYIIYQYQLLDLLLIRSIFEEHPSPKYLALKARLEKCDEMIQTLNEQCPKLIEIINVWLLNDLNEVLLDLYQCNLTLSNMTTNDVKMLKEKLTELRALSLTTVVAKN